MGAGIISLYSVKASAVNCVHGPLYVIRSAPQIDIIVNLRLDGLL